MLEHQLASATQLFAISRGAECAGQYRCHWCAAPCSDSFRHDDPGVTPFTKERSLARLPSESYVCAGCWMYRRGKTTVTYLAGGYTEKAAHALRESSKEALLAFLLSPPHRFVLSIMTDPGENLLHLAPVNARKEIRADAALGFAFNNVPHDYSVYELREALKRRQAKGKSPGVRVLLDYLGDAAVYEDDKPSAKKGAGRPAGQANLVNEHREVVRKTSGRQPALAQ
jgi:hypothetical protein